MKNKTPKCAGCRHCRFEDCNGSPNRYYCVHPAVMATVYELYQSQQLLLGEAPQ